MNEDPMKRDNSLAAEYAQKIRPLLPAAARAVGIQSQDSPSRLASEKVDALIREYADTHNGNMTLLAEVLDGDMSLPGLRRRLRKSRGASLAQFGNPRVRGTRDPEAVKAAAEKIRAARDSGHLNAYRDAVREVYADNVALSAVAEELGVTYYVLWSAGTSGGVSRAS